MPGRSGRPIASVHRDIHLGELGLSNARLPVVDALTFDVECLDRTCTSLDEVGVVAILPKFEPIARRSGGIDLWTRKQCQNHMSKPDVYMGGESLSRMHRLYMLAHDSYCDRLIATGSLGC